MLQGQAGAGRWGSGRQAASSCRVCSAAGSGDTAALPRPSGAAPGSGPAGPSPPSRTWLHFCSEGGSQANTPLHYVIRVH